MLNIIIRYPIVTPDILLFRNNMDLPVRINEEVFKAVHAFIIYYLMKSGKYCLNIMHILHSGENVKTCIFTAVKIQDLIFSRERNCKIGTTFFYFLNMA